jgi:hypothetical protein
MLHNHRPTHHPKYKKACTVLDLLRRAAAGGKQDSEELALTPTQSAGDQGKARVVQTSWVTSLVLVTLAVGVGFACLALLSATLIQGRLLSLVVDGVPVTMPQLAYAAQEWIVIRDDLNIKSKELERVENDKIVLDARGRTVQSKFGC